MNIKMFMRVGNVMSTFGAMIAVKRGRPMVNVLISTVRAIGSGMSNSYVRVIISFIAQVSRLVRKSGVRFAVITLKAWYTVTVRAVARENISDLQPYGCRFKRGMGGLPSIIPILHRSRILKGDAFILRLWLTLFSLYRVIEFPGVISLNTITRPFSLDPIITYGFSEFVRLSFFPSLKRMGSWLDSDFNPLEFLRGLVVRPFLILRSSPVHPEWLSTSPIGVLGALQAWLKEPQYLLILKDWLKLTGNIRFLNWLEEGFKLCISFPDITSGWLGKLGLKDEPAGKVRVFAIVDCITQWVFRPLHDKIFEILRVIPQDGTFDQTAPINRLIERGLVRFWSFDLSAATDRLPIVLQATLLSYFISSHGANLWMSLLVARAYRLPTRAVEATGESSVMYAVGQPMGALTSWAILALTHHALVQWAAFRAGVVIAGQWFQDYAVLGDDLVIANERVASMYLTVVREIGVSVGLHKSVQSRSGHGVIEFAKRIWLAGKQVGPVSILEVVAAYVSLSNWLELARKGQLSLSQALAVLGYRWRSLSSVSSRWGDLPRRLRVYVSSWYAPGGPGYISIGDFFSRTAIGELGLPSPSGDFLRELMGDFLKRISSLRERLWPLVRMVEVDRTRAHYGTTAWAADQWPHLEIPGPLTLAQVSWVMSLCEFVYREAFFTLLSDLRELESIVESIQDTLDPAMALDVLERLQKVEDDLSAIGMTHMTTQRKDDDRKIFKFIRGGVWSRRWLRWYRHRK